MQSEDTETELEEDKQPDTVGDEDKGWTPTNDVLAAQYSKLNMIDYRLSQLVEFTELINFIIKLACYAIIGAAIGWVLGTLLNLTSGHEH